LTGVEVMMPETSLASYRGKRAMVFLMISTDASNAPTALRHRLFFKPTAADSGDKELTLEGTRVAVQNDKPLVIGPPLRGRWAAGNGLSNDTGHRYAIIPINGQARIAQRFATDWVKFGDDGHIARGGDLSQNANYYGYGAEVLAVADAVVVGVKDGIPENVPRTKERAVPITVDTIAGNYVLLDLRGTKIMKCVACGSTSLVEGALVNTAGVGMTHFRLSDVPKWKSIFYKGIREVRAYGCVNCGHLQFAVDFSQEDLQRYRQFEGEQPSVLERINAETDGYTSVILEIQPLVFFRLKLNLDDSR
jgi:hypothetical protein